MDKKEIMVIGVRLIILIGLLALSVYFVEKCIFKFAKKATNFETTSTERITIENPTMTICFGPGYNELEMADSDIQNITVLDNNFYSKITYIIGQDFNITVFAPQHNINTTIYNEGYNELIGDKNGNSFNLEVKPIITLELGMCYKFISRSNLKGYFAPEFKMNLNSKLNSKPKSLLIVFTSEQNSKFQWNCI